MTESDAINNGMSPANSLSLTNYAGGPRLHGLTKREDFAKHLIYLRYGMGSRLIALEAVVQADDLLEALELSPEDAISEAVKEQAKLREEPSAHDLARQHAALSGNGFVG